VVFVEDGAALQDCKSFKLNIKDALSKYQSSVKVEGLTDNQMAAGSNVLKKRAFKELMEQCAQIMGRKDNYKTVYTLDGVLLDTLDDLKQYCEVKNPKTRRLEVNVTNATPMSHYGSPPEAKSPVRKMVGGVSFVIGNNRRSPSSVTDEELKLPTLSKYETSP